MADLLATQAGLDTLNRIACFLGRRRMSRNLKRSFYIAFDGWRNTGYFDKSVMLNELNELTQDELVELNTLLGELGCLENATQAPMTIYVDSVNGSDVSGDGSSTHPYESMAFLSLFPRYINHNVRIILLEDLDMDTDPLNLNFTVGPNGCFSLIGQSAFSRIITSAGLGPFTVTAVTSHGTAPTSDYAHVLTFAETWGVDELYGKWLRFESGANDDEVFQIHMNSANSIIIRGGCSVNPSIGDTISIIEPAITLSCQRINMEMSGPENNYAATFDSSRLNIMNLKLDLRGAYTESNHLVLKNSLETQISFVTIITDNSIYDAVVLKSNLNQYPSADVDIATYTMSSVGNINGDGINVSTCGILLYNSDFLPPDFTFNSLVINGPDLVKCIDTRGFVRIIGNVQDILLCGFGLVLADGSPVCDFKRTLIDGGATSHSISFINCGSWQLSRIYFTSPGLNVLNLQGVILRISSTNLTFDAAAVFTGYACNYHLFGFNVVIANSSLANLSAATANDIWFPGGVGITAFPLADAQATNSLGSVFNYVSTP